MQLHPRLVWPGRVSSADDGWLPGVSIADQPVTLTWTLPVPAVGTPVMELWDDFRVLKLFQTPLTPLKPRNLDVRLLDIHKIRVGALDSQNTRRPSDGGLDSHPDSVALPLGCGRNNEFKTLAPSQPLRHSEPRKSRLALPFRIIPGFERQGRSFVAQHFEHAPAAARSMRQLHGPPVSATGRKRRPAFPRRRNRHSYVRHACGLPRQELPARRPTRRHQPIEVQHHVNSKHAASHAPTVM